MKSLFFTVLIAVAPLAVFAQGDPSPLPDMSRQQYDAAADAENKRLQGNNEAAPASTGYKAPKGTYWDFPASDASDRYKADWKIAHQARKQKRARRKSAKDDGDSSPDGN